MIILATASPYRIQAFEMLRMEFKAIEANIEETFEGRPGSSRELVLELAKRKAEAVKDEGLIIGFDSVGVLHGEILEKPKDREEGISRLRRMAGKEIHLITGVHMIYGDRILSDAVDTKVQMRDIDDEEINRYIDQDPKFQSICLGFNPLETYSSTFALKIEGSYNNFTRGIPLERIVGMLKEIGYL